MDQKEKTYLKNLYREGKLSFEKDYFKSLLNLSAGALALSITIAQIGFSSNPVLGWLLIFSWILLGVAVLSVLIYFILGQYEYDKRIEDLEYEDTPLKHTDKEIDELAHATDAKIKGRRVEAFWILNEKSFKRKTYNKLGLISSFSFIIGIIALGFFTYSNLFQHSNSMNDETTPPSSVEIKSKNNMPGLQDSLRNDTSRKDSSRSHKSGQL